MRATLERLNAWPIRQRAALLEAAVYFTLVLLWVLLVPADYPGRFILGSMAVAAPAAAGALQVFFSFNSLPKARREAWLYLGLALAGWAVRHFLWIFLGPRGQSLADERPSQFPRRGTPGWRSDAVLCLVRTTHTDWPNGDAAGPHP